MNVLIFTSLYPNNIWPYHGVFIKERISHVAKLERCMVKVIAPVPYFPPLKFGRRWKFSQITRQERRDGLEVYHPRYFMTPKSGMALYGVLMFLSVLPIIKKIQRHFDFHIIDAHYVYPDGFAAILLGRFFRKPVTVSARGSDINLYREFPLIRKLLQYTLHRANQVITVCQALKGAMIELGIPQEKIAVIPNGVDLTKFHPCPKTEARRRLGLAGDKRVILSVGSLNPVKGFDLLIRALKILVDQYHEKDLCLVIVGEGTSQQELENVTSSLHLQEYVYLAGSVSHQELYLWYSAADLFCLASSREGWPNVLLESLACGTPVVATDVGGIPEIICSDRIGLVTKRGEQEMAASIFFALKKSWEFDRLRQYAQEHTWDRAAASVFHIFESVLSTPFHK